MSANKKNGKPPSVDTWYIHIWGNCHRDVNCFQKVPHSPVAEPGTESIQCAVYHIHFLLLHSHECVK